MATSSVVQVTSGDFEREVLQSDLPVLVDFWATWCGPCKAIAPLVEEVASLYAGRLKVCKVDVDSAPDVATSYGIRSIPTLLLFKGGKVLDQRVGGLSRERLQELVEKAL